VIHAAARIAHLSPQAMMESDIAGGQGEKKAA
jgi:hypothetical protein